MPKTRSHGDGGLYYLKSRRLWRGVVDLEPDPITGERRQKYVHARKQVDCRAKLKKLLAEIDAHGAPLDRTVTLGDWSSVWLEDHVKPNVDPNTYAGYLSYTNRWIVPTLGKKVVRDLKPSDVAALHTAIRKAGRKTATLRRIHVALDLMLAQARREGLCERNVAKDVRLPKLVKGERGSIPVDKAAELMEKVAATDLGSYWWFKLLEGPRQGESLGASLSDLDLEVGSYRVKWKLEELTKEHGCGPQVDGAWRCGKKQGAACSDARWRIPHDFEMQHLFGRWALTRPKSQTGRYVPLIAQVSEMIGDYLDRHADDPNPHGLIWRKADGSPYLPKEEAQMWRDTLHEVGIITKDQTAPGKSPIDGHWARHTTVTLLMMLTGDAQLVGEIVGHSSREVTEIYRHADETEKHAAMNKLGTLIGEHRPKALGA